MLDSSAFSLQKRLMDLFAFFLSDVGSSFAYEQLEPMPVRMALEREEKQRDEPLQLSSLR
jgi:hypothetical protein